MEFPPLITLITYQMTGTDSRGEKISRSVSRHKSEANMHPMSWRKCGEHTEKNDEENDSGPKTRPDRCAETLRLHDRWRTSAERRDVIYRLMRFCWQRTS